MAKNAVASEELASKFRTEKETPYTRWVKAEGLDIISAHYVRNLRTVELKPWARRGGHGVFVNHEASRTSNDCYVCEIPAGGKLAPQRQPRLPSPASPGLPWPGPATSCFPPATATTPARSSFSPAGPSMSACCARVSCPGRRTAPGSAMPSLALTR